MNTFFLYNSVPFHLSWLVVGGVEWLWEGGGVGVVIVVASVCLFSGQTHHTSIPTVVVS